MIRAFPRPRFASIEAQQFPVGHQQGVVLLSVLLIVALLSALAVRMTTRHGLIVAQASQVSGADVTLNYALGAEAFARQLLYRDFEQEQRQQASSDHFGDAWAQPLQPFELEEYESAFLELQLRDLGGCFNLNSLASQEANERKQLLQNMLNYLGLSITIADLWLDWVDADDAVTGAGAEDSEYLLADIPYRSANNLAADPSELKLLRGVDPEQINQLLPYVCTLPTTELLININTAPAAVLASLNPEFPQQQLAALTGGDRRYDGLEEAQNEYPALVAGAGFTDVKSKYFELLARVQIDDNLTELAAVLWRSDTDGQLRTISRDLSRNFVSLYEENEEEE